MTLLQSVGLIAVAVIGTLGLLAAVLGGDFS